MPADVRDSVSYPWSEADDILPVEYKVNLMH